MASEGLVRIKKEGGRENIFGELGLFIADLWPSGLGGSTGIEPAESLKN